MLKILLITHKFYPDIGGIEVNSEILAEHFTRIGARVHVVTWSKVTQEKDFSFKIIRKPKLTTLWEEHRWADVVFENNPSLRLAWPVYFLKKKHIVAVRTWICQNTGKSRVKEKIKLEWLKKANAVIAISQQIKNQSFSKAVVIGNPYRDQLFRVTNSGNREREFVFLGRLVSDKGADLAVMLLDKLNQESSKKNKLTIIGDGPERKNLEKMVVNYNLEGLVNFEGYLREQALVDCLNQHKYLLVPSRWREPFGNIALEGMACGCLPIVSDGGGLPDAVGNAGVVFKRNCLKSLLKKVNTLLENPNQERYLRSNFEKHLANHKPQFVAGEYYTIIERAFSS